MAIAPQNERWPDKYDVDEICPARQCVLFILILIVALLSWLVPVWRDNLDENGASIRMRRGGRVSP